MKTILAAMNILLHLMLFGILVLTPAHASGEAIDVFVFAGQSNMEGADSKVADVDRFPPFRGVTDARGDVRFWHVIGREDKADSRSWVPLQPVRGMVGPELVFARDVSRAMKGEIAIVKVAAGGTHLGGDWNRNSIHWISVPNCCFISCCRLWRINCKRTSICCLGLATTLAWLA